MLVHELLQRSVDRDPGGTAVVESRRSRSYAELGQDAAQVGQVLIASGVRRGDRVVLALDNSDLWVAAFFGILQAGAVVVPLAPGAKNDRLQYAIRDCTPAACIVDDATAGLLAPVVPDACAVLIDRPIGGAPTQRVRLEPGTPAVAAVSGFTQPDVVSGFSRTTDAVCNRTGHGIDLRTAMAQVPVIAPQVRVIDVDLAAIIYTSGSTGAPRGVMLSHLNLTANAESIVHYLRLTARDRVMVILPFHYVYGLSLLTTHISAGGSLAIDNRFAFPNAVLQSMQQFEVTGFAGVPSTFALLLHRSSVARMDFPSLRYVTQAGGPLPPALLREWLSVMPDVPFYVMYGATEASARLAYLEPGELPARIGSIGKAIPNVELVIVREDGELAAPGEVGEIVARGSNIMMGYWNRPEETHAAVGPFGYRTGDLARCDADGFLYIVGRRHDMLKVGAERVGAKEIEDVLHEHVAVHEAAVVGAPHELLGEVPVAFVSLCLGAEASGEEILAFCRERLSDHKVPVRILVERDLPKNPAGKIDKPALRHALAEAATV